MSDPHDFFGDERLYIDDDDANAYGSFDKYLESEECKQDTDDLIMLNLLGLI